MKILQLSASLSRKAGGLFESVRRMSQELHYLGNEITVCGLRDEFSEADRGHWAPLRPSISDVKLFRRYGYSPELGRRLFAVDPDLVHAHGVWMYPSSCLSRWQKRTSRPFVVSPRGMLEPWAMEYHQWKKLPLWYLREKRFLNSASVLHATSLAEARNLRALGLQPPIAVIPNGVDVPGANTADVRNSGRTALFLSRIHPVKGILNLLEAWNKVRPQNWKLLIAGPDDGDHRKDVLSRCRRLNLSDIVTLRGPVYGQEKWDLFQSADLFILPSHSENFGIVIAEALASGTPVITTRCTPWQQLRTDGCGWWIDFGVEPLAKAIEEAVHMDQETLAQMGIRGRELVKQQYSWRKLAQEMDLVYKWILHKTEVPRCVSV